MKPLVGARFAEDLLRSDESVFANGSGFERFAADTVRIGAEFE
jgi:hypothetical protein